MSIAKDPVDADLRDIETLRSIMRALRAPETGCPWDQVQTFETIAPYTIEEAYEVADAIERQDNADLCDELGDLLLQVIYHAQMAEEAGLFSFEDVTEAISNKMIRRHPHVFGDEAARSAPPKKGFWENIKAGERARRTGAGSCGLLDDVPVALPALMRAQKLQKRAARVGFDWPEASGVFEKVEEELDELRAASSAGDPAMIEDELGDVLFTLVNLARHLDVAGETALRRSNAKFTNRFKTMEAMARRAGQPLDQYSTGELEDLWKKAKADQDA